MPQKLPKGWVRTTLGEVCTKAESIRPENTPEKEFTYFDIGGIDNQSNRIVQTKTFPGHEAPSRARQVVRTGDILFSTVRTYLMKIARIESNYPNPVASTGFTVIRAAEGVSSQFLFFLVLSEDFLQPLHGLQSGSSYPAVRDKDVFAQVIPLPPYREQERIVAKLDALLSRVVAGEAAARRALERLNHYRAAVLHAAVTGELTRDWRKSHKPDETGAQLLKRILKVRRSRFELHWLSGELSRFVTGLKKRKIPRSRVSVLERFLWQLCSFQDEVQTSGSWDGNWIRQWNEFKSIKNLYESTDKQPSSTSAGVMRFRRDFAYLQSGHWKSHFYSEPHLPKVDSLAEIPRSWTFASIDQLGWTSGYGTSVKCTYDAKGPAVLRIPNIRNQDFDFADLKFATRSEDISDEDFVAPGDLLLIRTNGSIDLIGRAAVAKTALPKKCSFASYLIRFRLVGDKTIWSWVSLMWGSDLLRSAIRSRAATTAGQYNVSLSGLADLPLPLPPLLEQKAIAREVERRLTAADRLATTLNSQLERARVTRQALLREAFAGKLVSQDAKDEPASVLLERTRAAREAGAKKPKAERMPKPKLKSVETLEQLEGLIHDLGKAATPERVLLAARLGDDVDDVEKFFDLLRAGRDKGSLVVPVGKGAAIRRVQHAD